MSKPFDGKLSSEINTLLGWQMPTQASSTKNNVDPLLPVVSSLPSAAYTALKGQLEANYHFNKVLHDQYRFGPSEQILELNKIFWACLDDTYYANNIEYLKKVANDGFSEDEKYFGERLQLLTTTKDPQRLLDDIHEKIRCDIFQREAIMDQKNLTSMAGSLLQQSVYANALDILKELEPYLSGFQTDYIKHCKLQVNAKNGLDRLFDISGYQASIVASLKSISAGYEKLAFKQGVDDIKERLNALTLSPIKAINYALITSEQSKYDTQLEHNRGIFYYLHHLLADAKNKYKHYLTIAMKQKKTAEKLSVSVPLSNQPLAIPIPAPLCKPLPSTAEAKPASAALSAPQQPLPDNQAPSAAIAKPGVTLVSDIKDEKGVAFKPILFSEKKPQNSVVQPTEHPLAKKLSEDKESKLLLETLFEGRLSAAKITQKAVTRLLEVIGCHVSVKGVRTKFSLADTIGYAFNFSPKERKIGGYHTKGKDKKKHGGKNPVLHAVVLEHVKDFLERINVTPLSLWSKQGLSCNSV